MTVSKRHSYSKYRSAEVKHNTINDLKPRGGGGEETDPSLTFFPILSEIPVNVLFHQRIYEEPERVQAPNAKMSRMNRSVQQHGGLTGNQWTDTKLYTNLAPIH